MKRAEGPFTCEYFPGGDYLDSAWVILVSGWTIGERGNRRDAAEDTRTANRICKVAGKELAVSVGDAEKRIAGGKGKELEIGGKDGR